MNQDEKFIKYSLKLAEMSALQGENPFGSVLVYKGKIVSYSGNKTNSTSNVIQHAELRVLLRAQKKLDSKELEKSTLYTNCEPCPMCAFVIRELKIGRVVYALASPYMGGHTKWNILEDQEFELFSPVFCKPPEVCAKILENSALKIFNKAGWGKMLIK